MDSNRVAQQARQHDFTEEVAPEQPHRVEQDVHLHPKPSTPDEPINLEIPFEMDARDETALIGAYERAVATCRIEQSTMPVLQEEGSLPTKDDADLQQRALSEDHCPQPRDGSSPDLEQHEQQVLQSDGTHSSQSEGNASGATDDGNFVPIEYDVDAWDDTELVAAYERAIEMGNNSNRAKKKNGQRKRKRQGNDNVPQPQTQSLHKHARHGRQVFPTPPAQEQRAFERGVEGTLSRVPVPPKIMLPKLVPSQDWMTAIPDEVEPVRAAKRVRFSVDSCDELAPEIDPRSNHSAASPTHVAESMIPPPPPAILAGQRLSPKLEELLKSWYIAGYRAGVVASTRTRQ